MVGGSTVKKRTYLWRAHGIFGISLSDNRYAVL